MKKTAIILLIAVAVAIAVLNAYQLSQINLNEREKPEKIELGDVMTKLQRHSNKLWFAGINENWELTAFYIEELEESFEELSGKDIEENGVNISLLSDQMGLGSIKPIENSVKSKNIDEFRKSYIQMVNQCNACHIATKYGFVIIKPPLSPLFDNQEYGNTRSN